MQYKFIFRAAKNIKKELKITYGLVEMAGWNMKEKNTY